MYLNCENGVFSPIRIINSSVKLNSIYLSFNVWSSCIFPDGDPSSHTLLQVKGCTYTHDYTCIYKTHDDGPIERAELNHDVKKLRLHYIKIKIAKKKITR